MTRSELNILIADLKVDLFSKVRDVVDDFETAIESKLDITEDEVF